MDLNNMNNDEILNTDIENTVQPVMEPMASPAVEPVMQTMTNPEPVQPVMEPMSSSAVEPLMQPMTNPEPVQPVMEPMSSPAVEPLMQPMTNPEPVHPVMEPMASPEVEPLMQPMTNPEPVQPVTEPIAGPVEVSTQEAPASLEPEKKSSVLKVLLMIILVLAVIAGGYYIYTEFFAKSSEDKEKPEELIKEEEKSYQTWNAIYKKDESTNQLMLFAADEEKVSLMLAQEIDFGGTKGLGFPVQYYDTLQLRNGKISHYEDDKEQITIEKNGDKITVTFVGDKEKEEDYLQLVGTYTKTKVVKSFDSDEFEIK